MVMATSLFATAGKMINPLNYPSGVKSFMGKIYLKPVKNLPQADDFSDFIKSLQNLRSDITPEFIKLLLLDSSLYLKENPDVASAGLCPIYHYYSYGNKEGRNFTSPNFRAIHSSINNPSEKRVVFFDTIKSNASFLYRGFFPEIRNQDSEIIHQETPITEAVKSIFSAKEVVFIRPSHSSQKTLYFINLCKKLSIKVILDYDDLLLPEYVYCKGSVRSGVTPFHPMVNHLNKDSSMFLPSDEVICSTPLIHSAYDGFIKSRIISRNKLPKEYFVSELDAKKVDPIRGKLKILYLSGSKTHLKDYSLISGALLKLAQNYNDEISISFMGSLNDQTSVFSSLGVHCDLLPFMSFDEMISTISNYDLVLVPLEESVFNSAKSNIKFIEAASQAVPVIASPVDEYRECIEHGMTGWLCNSDADWYSTLEGILLNREVLGEVGFRAYKKALEEFSV